MQKFGIAAAAALGVALLASPGPVNAAPGMAPGATNLVGQGKSSVTDVRYRGGPTGLSGSHANFGNPAAWGWGGPGWYGPGWGRSAWPFVGVGVWGGGWGYPGWGYRYSRCGYPGWGGCGW